VHLVSFIKFETINPNKIQQSSLHDTQYSTGQTGEDIKQVPYWGPTNTGHHS